MAPLALGVEAYPVEIRISKGSVKIHWGVDEPLVYVVSEPPE
jgi:hypothetical protein